MAWNNAKIIDWSEIIGTPAANFTGEYSATTDYNYGDVCLRENEIWVYNSKEWFCLGEENPQLKYITNCPNCGAPMTNHKCAYCGTEDYGRR